MTPRYLSTVEAATYLGTTPTALRKRVERGETPYHKIGRRLWFDRLELDGWMQAHRVEAWS